MTQNIQWQPRRQTGKIFGRAVSPAKAETVRHDLIKMFAKALGAQHEKPFFSEPRNDR